MHAEILQLTSGNHQRQGTGGDRLWDFRHGSCLLRGALALRRVRLAVLVCRGLAGSIRALYSFTSGCQLIQMLRETS